MTAYLVIVLLLVPAADGKPLTTELHQEVLSASTDEACQRHADAKADEQRRKHADAVRRMGARVVGQCRRLGGMT